MLLRHRADLTPVCTAEFVLVTIACREGRVVLTDHEHTWLRAWRYANHFRAAFDGDVFRSRRTVGGRDRPARRVRAAREP